MVRRGIIFYGENMFRNIFDEILQHQCSPSPKQPVASAAILSKRPVRDEFVPSTSLPLLPTENVQETEEPFETTQKLKYHTCTVVLNNTIRQDLPQDDKYTFIQKFNQAMSNKVSKQVQYFQKVPSQRPIYDFLHLHIPKRCFTESSFGPNKTSSRETGPEAEGGVKPGEEIILEEDLTENRSTDATRRRIGQIKGFLKNIIINAEIREQITEERLSELCPELNEQ
ncbi:hypothetical protein BDF21DRAFT_405148 [Thamnidium elegans]|nr:hypothetical protein BDF21DRAFT_405148 [Thamnidium elegans]